MISNAAVVLMILVCAACTFLTRALPFFIFRSGVLPESITYLGNALPLAIMFCLIIYCIRNTQFFSYPFGLPQLLGIASVAILHLWKRNMIISIAGGTLLYMLMVQLIFL